MSMTGIVQTGLPKSFPYPDQHLIKGLNTEAVARVVFPKPSWIADCPEYLSLLPSEGEMDFTNGFFSLNISIYNQPVVPSEWENMWFLITGRIHPYTLNWEVEQGDGLNTDGPHYYSLPALIVRDQGYQPSV